MRNTKKFIQDSNFQLIKYEDLLDDEVSIFKDLCHFMNLAFSKNILDIEQADSSYVLKDNSHKLKGINKELKNKWKDYIHPIVNYLFKILLRKEMKYFGY